MLYRFINARYLCIIPAVTLALSLASCDSDDGSVAVVPGISWTVPSTREDGTALAANEIGGYRVYYGLGSGNYSDYIEIVDGLAQNFDPSTISGGLYYFVLTVLDSDGRESDYSNELSMPL